jgi:hypothetical protein
VHAEVEVTVVRSSKQLLQAISENEVHIELQDHINLAPTASESYTFELAEHLHSIRVCFQSASLSCTLDPPYPALSIQCIPWQ